MIEVERLIRPVSAENPAGESLRYSTVYDAIKAARQEDDPNLPRGIWQMKLKKADWLEVRNLCQQALESRSKDLQIAAWLLEACIHIDGFAGLADGLQVLTALCENFWDTLYPAIDPEDPEFRFGPIVWIDEKLTLKLKLIPITNPKGGDEPPYTWADWENALFQSRIPAQKEKPGSKKQDPLKSLQSRFTASASLTSNDFYIDLKRQLDNALSEADRFEDVLSRLDERQHGTLHQVKEVLRAIYYYVGQVLVERNVVDTRPEPGIEPEDEPPMIEEEQQDMVVREQRETFSGPIRSRAQAYQMLSEAAEYLMRTEPHSPTPYLVKRAVAWGGLTLGELLQQILRNPNDLGEMYRLLGLDELPQKGKKAHRDTGD